MPTLIFRSEVARKAFSYISEKRRENPQMSLHALLDDAGMRFNLTPADCSYLERLLQEQPNMREEN